MSHEAPKQETAHTPKRGRGRPLGSTRGQKEQTARRAEFAINALREIVGARPFRDGVALVGMSDTQAGFDSMAFQWTQAYAAGMLKRLDEGTV
jgi:hypothetical protein